MCRVAVHPLRPGPARLLVTLLLLPGLGAAGGCHLLFPFGGERGSGGDAAGDLPPALDQLFIPDAPPPPAPDLDLAATTAVWTDGGRPVKVSKDRTVLAVEDLGDPRSAFVLCYHRQAAPGPNHVPACQLAPGQVEITLLAPGQATVSYQVVQIQGAWVQRGSLTLAVGELAAAARIYPVAPGRSFVLVSSTTAETSVQRDERRLVMGSLPDPSQVRLSRLDSGARTQVQWQVVQLPAQLATVQAGLSQIVNRITQQQSQINQIFGRLR